MEELYGNKGIDTRYEREIIDYRPKLEANRLNHNQRIEPQILQKVTRAKDFTITSVLTGYDQLVKMIEALMAVLREKNQTTSFKSYMTGLDAGEVKNVWSLEEASCGIEGNGDMEIYTVLSYMKASCSNRREFIDGHFRVQFTNETDLAAIEQAELESIESWVRLEEDFVGLSDELKTEYRDDDHHESDQDSAQVSYLESELITTEVSKKTMETFHTSLADTSYIHRNRIVMFSNLIKQLQMLVHSASVVMSNGMYEYIKRASTLPNFNSAKAHLMLAFTETKKAHDVIKGQYTMVDDKKEQVASRLQWMNQQVQTNFTHDLTTWLYNQDEGSSAFDAFANLMVNSIAANQNKYDTSVTDLLKFYQQESAFYEKQVMYIQTKEQIRQYFRILKDIEDTKTITNEWIEQYLMTNEYSY